MKHAHKFWDKIAPKHTKPTLSLGKTSQKTMEYTKEHLKPADVVLDFGCGGGNITLAIADHIQSIEGIDFSKGMITAAIDATTTYKITNAHFRQISLFDEQLITASYDVILAFNVLHYMHDITETTNRINSLLKAGGLFISSTACLKEKRSLMCFIMNLVTRIGLIPEMKFYSIQELTTVFKEANFDIIQTKMVSSLPECFIVSKKL